jgi:hypothetical protein
MANSWSLKKELCGLAHAGTAKGALCRLGVISEAFPNVLIKEVENWTRTGSETFEYRFRVVSREGVRNVVLKAIVAFSTTQSLSEITHEWVVRRRLLESEGLNTPALYCAQRALLMEEFVPHKLSTFLRAAATPQNGLADQVTQIAAILDRLGFCPISPFDSLRTDGADVFMVDFGQALGPPAKSAHCSDRLLSEAIAWLNSCQAKGQSVDEDQATALYRRYADPKHEAGRWT